MASTKRMLLVTDSAGRIVGAAHLDGPQQKGMNVGIVPLAGQQIHEVDVPEDLLKLKSGPAFQLALSQAKFSPAPGKIQFKPIRSEKLKH